MKLLFFALYGSAFDFSNNRGGAHVTTAISERPKAEVIRGLTLFCQLLSDRETVSALLDSRNREMGVMV
jgi:hypothetical protein